MHKGSSRYSAHHDLTNVVHQQQHHRASPQCQATFTFTVDPGSLPFLFIQADRPTGHALRNILQLQTDSVGVGLGACHHRRGNQESHQTSRPSVAVCEIPSIIWRRLCGCTATVGDVFCTQRFAAGRLFFSPNRKNSSFGLRDHTEWMTRKKTSQPQKIREKPV